MAIQWSKELGTYVNYPDSGPTQVFSGPPNQQMTPATPQQRPDLWENAWTPAVPQQSGGGGGSTYVANRVFYNGQWYDLNNEGDRQAYADAKMTEVNQEYKAAMKSGNYSYASQLAELGQQIGEISSSKNQYLQGWEQNERNLTEGYNLGMTRRQNMFTGLGPRAYQSSMGTSGNYALGKYNEGENQLSQDKKYALAAYAAAEARAKRAKQDLANAFNTWSESVGRQAQQSGEGVVNAMANVPGFNYQAAGVKVPQFAQTDLSGYTPYTTFSGFASSPMAQQAMNMFSPAKKLTQQAEAQPGLEGYLGYKSPEEEDKSLNMFLAGKSSF